TVLHHPATSALPSLSLHAALPIYFHPAAVDHVVGAAEDLQHAIGDPAQVLGAKPAVVQLPRRRVAVARGQHVAGQLDPAGGPDAYVDTVQWPAVVDTTAAGLRHSVGADGVYPGVAGVRADFRWQRSAADHDGVEGPGGRQSGPAGLEQPDELGRDERRVVRSWLAQHRLGGGREIVRTEARRQIEHTWFVPAEQRPD